MSGKKNWNHFTFWIILSIVKTKRNSTQLKATQSNSRATSVGVRHFSQVKHPTPPHPDMERENALKTPGTLKKNEWTNAQMNTRKNVTSRRWTNIPIFGHCHGKQSIAKSQLDLNCDPQCRPFLPFFTPWTLEVQLRHNLGAKIINACHIYSSSSLSSTS